MQVTFNKKRDFVFEAKFELPYSNEEIISALKAETWIPEIAGYGMENLVSRYTLDNVTIKDPKLNEIKEFFTSRNFKRTQMGLLYEQPDWVNLWGVKQEVLYDHTSSYARFYLDKPGFNTLIHIDNRTLINNGICYFISGDDPDQSTLFFNNVAGDNPLRIPTGHGLGWLAANTHNSWHTGENKSNQDRYHISFGITLKFMR